MVLMVCERAKGPKESHSCEKIGAKNLSLLPVRSVTMLLPAGEPIGLFVPHTRSISAFHLSTSLLLLLLLLLQVSVLSLQLYFLLGVFVKHDAKVSSLPTILNHNNGSGLHSCQKCHSE